MQAPGARLVVDGNNLMGSRPDGWWRDREGAARRLVGCLQAWAQSERAEVLVVFDGPPPESQPMGASHVQVVHAGGGRRDAADDLIAAMVAETPGDVTAVVTSDAGLAARVRAHGVRVCGAGTFRDALPGD